MASHNGPMSLEELVLLPSRPDVDEPPAELREGSPFQEFTFEGPPERAPEITIDRITDIGGEVLGWRLQSSEQFSVGLSIGEGRQIEATGDLGAADEGEAFLPAWSGIQYMPLAAPPTERKVLRRRSGRLVTGECVLGEYQRFTYYPLPYPWRCVGQVIVWPFGTNVPYVRTGTGALVGKNIVVTASHVFPWFEKEVGLNPKMKFVPASYGGGSLYGSNAASWVRDHCGYPDHSQGDDIVVLRLQKDLGSLLGYFGYKTYSDEWEGQPKWLLAGYPASTSPKPAMDWGFPIDGSDDDGAGVELEYHADTSGGNSGSPVYGYWGGMPHIVGVHSGCESELGGNENAGAGGSALSSLIHWARTNW